MARDIYIYRMPRKSPVGASKDVFITKLRRFDLSEGNIRETLIFSPPLNEEAAYETSSPPYLLNLNQRHRYSFELAMKTFD